MENKLGKVDFISNLYVINFLKINKIFYFVFCKRLHYGLLHIIILCAMFHSIHLTILFLYYSFLKNKTVGRLSREKESEL